MPLHRSLRLADIEPVLRTVPLDANGFVHDRMVRIASCLSILRIAAGRVIGFFMEAFLVRGGRLIQEPVNGAPEAFYGVSWNYQSLCIAAATAGCIRSMGRPIINK